MLLLGCLLVVGFSIAPRVMLVLAWLFSDRWQVVWGGEWLWPLLGIIFLPYTTIMYVLVWTANGIEGWDWMLDHPWPDPRLHALGAVVREAPASAGLHDRHCGGRRAWLDGCHIDGGTVIRSRLDLGHAAGLGTSGDAVGCAGRGGRDSDRAEACIAWTWVAARGRVRRMPQKATRDQRSTEATAPGCGFRPPASPCDVVSTD